LEQFLPELPASEKPAAPQPAQGLRVGFLQPPLFHLALKDLSACHRVLRGSSLCSR
jgi:hypothetical protein